MTLRKATELIGGHEYPTTNDQLAATYEEYELDLPNGTETLGEVFTRLPTEEYATSEEAQTAMYSAVSSKAIGREGYSDRDPTLLGTDGPEPVSF